MSCKSLALLTIFAALLLGFSTLHSNAQSYLSVTQVGTVTQNTTNYMSLSVRATSYNDLLNPTSVTGTINMAGFMNWGFGINIGAPVQSIVPGTTKINNVAYKQVVLTSKPFQYTDYNIGITTTAVMQATVIQYKRGTISFRITDATTGVTLIATATPDGQLAAYSLITGSTSIRF